MTEDGVTIEGRNLLKSIFQSAGFSRAAQKIIIKHRNFDLRIRSRFLRFRRPAPQESQKSFCSYMLSPILTFPSQPPPNFSMTSQTHVQARNMTSRTHPGVWVAIRGWIEGEDDIGKATHSLRHENLSHSQNLTFFLRHPTISPRAKGTVHPTQPASFIFICSPSSPLRTKVCSLLRISKNMLVIDTRFEVILQIYTLRRYI